MYVRGWPGSLCSWLWHQTRAGEGPQCFSPHCHPSSQLGEVRDCVIYWSVLFSEASASVMKLTSPHCLSSELHDAQQVSEDERESLKTLQSLCCSWSSDTWHVYFCDWTYPLSNNIHVYMYIIRPVYLKDMLSCINKTALASKWTFECFVSCLDLSLDLM